MTKKFDGVIEAVRYNRKGHVALVRIYELRGVTYSDRILLDRDALLERLKDGKKIITGQRKEYWGTTFTPGKIVKIVSTNGKDFLSTRNDNSKRDELENTPVF